MKAYKLLGRRKENSINQADLARELGLNAATLTDIENGRLGIDAETFAAINSAIDKLIGAEVTTGQLIDTKA